MSRMFPCLNWKEARKGLVFSFGIAKFVQLTEDGEIKYGYVKYNGEILSEAIFDTAEHFGFHFAFVEKDGKNGKIDRDGNVKFFDFT